MRKLVILAFVLVALAGVGWRYRVAVRTWLQPTPSVTIPEAITLAELRQGSTATTTPTSTIADNQRSTINDQLLTTPLPASFNLSVPFTTQAPHANWGYPYQEACEEAALLTLHYYWQKKVFTPDLTDAEILELVSFQNELLGSPDGYRDTDASTTAWVTERYWPQYQTLVVYDWTVEDIEREVAAGRPVIVFAYGKALGNPNFRNGGPLYHALVIKGYTSTRFITNDVGTRKGADYTYLKETLLNASHDWNGGDVQNGRRAMLVLEPR